MKKPFLIILGFILLTLGAVGVVIPVLPTTPFVVFAATCFSLSNKKLDAWLQRSRVFGQYIENYKTGGGISLFRKIAAIVLLWLGLIFSMILISEVWGYLVLGAVGIAVTVHLLLIKTRKKDKK